MPKNSILTNKQTDRPASRINKILMRNKIVLRNSLNLVLSNENKVNLNAWIVPNSTHQNVGDYLSVVVLEYVCGYFGIDCWKDIGATKHLYAIGSILLGYQNATIWGSGFGFDNSKSKYFSINALIHKYYHKIDIRAVRGPETKRIFERMGIKCPDIYGDPAILMPLFYNRTVEKNEKYIVIPHYSKLDKYQGNQNVLGTFTKDWKGFIDRILGAEIVISSSLHGIILAEVYGVPAIMLADTPSEDITKYKDWYYSTGRKEFPIAKTVEDALTMTPMKIGDGVIEKMQNDLLSTFPLDLWENKNR